MKLEMKDYTIMEKVGSGCFGTAHLCVRNSDGKKFVVKEVDLEEMNDEQCQAALEETRILSSLSHPNVIGYVGCQLRSDSLLILMELAPLGSLARMLRDRNNVPLPFDGAMSVFVQMLLGLEHVHERHVLHRDLNARNVLLAVDAGGRTLVKLADFGVAKHVLGTGNMASTQTGTHLSPEVCQGRSYGPPSDVWALGCVFYQTLTFRNPFPATNVAALARSVLHGEFSAIPPSLYPVPALPSLLSALLATSPRSRISLADAKRHPVVVPHLARAAADIGRIV